MTDRGMKSAGETGGDQPGFAGARARLQSGAQLGSAQLRHLLSDQGQRMNHGRNRSNRSRGDGPINGTDPGAVRVTGHQCSGARSGDAAGEQISLYFTVLGDTYPQKHLVKSTN